jgi:hypothetical protein
MFDPDQKRNQRKQEKRARARKAQGFSLKKDKIVSRFLTPEQKAPASPPRNPELENIRRFKAGSNHFLYEKEA